MCITKGFHTSNQFACLGGGGGFSGSRRIQKGDHLFSFGKTAGSLGACHGKERANANGFVWGAPDLGFSGEALALIKGWCRVVFRIIWGIFAWGGIIFGVALGGRPVIVTLNVCRLSRSHSYFFRGQN